MIIADFKETKEFNEAILKSLESSLRYNIFLSLVHLDFAEEQKNDDSIEIIDLSLTELSIKLANFNSRLLYFRQASDCMRTFNTLKQLIMHSSINIQVITVR